MQRADASRRGKGSMLRSTSADRATGLGKKEPPRAQRRRLSIAPLGEQIEKIIVMFLLGLREYLMELRVRVLSFSAMV